MKKALALLLAITLSLSVISPVFAAGPGSKLTARNPVIYISGDSNKLAYDNETKTFQIDNMLSIFKDSEEGNISEAAFNILYPLIIDGIAFDDWDPYYDALYKEISDVYAPLLLDGDGNPATDCDIPQWQKDDNAAAMVQDRKNANGRYREKAYEFHYDWRLDPVEIADQLHEYIEGVKRATGHAKVEISVKCLGNNVVLAYIKKYGTDSLKGVGIDVATSMGSEFLSGVLSGDFGIDGNAIARMATDLTERHNVYVDLARFVTSTVDLLDNVGAIDALTKVSREKLYEKIEYGIISALALSTFMTFPGYWAMVSYDKFDTAVEYVFGDENSEKREAYKGLIEKITYYNEEIKKNALPILKTLESGGVNVGIISKYGVQMVPTLKESIFVGDEYVSAAHSSLGATTSTVYSTLSDEYIAEREAAGYGKYISPDKQIDASTCLFPNSTWFFKGVSHGYYTQPEMDILLTVMDADRQLTIDDFNWTQFVVFSYETSEAAPMTTENCNTEYWTADEKTDHPVTKSEKLQSFLKSLFRWLGNLIKLLINNSNKDEK